MKKRTIVMISVVSLLALGGGGFGVYKVIQTGGAAVEVIPVSNFSQNGMFGDNNVMSGIITTNISQEVHLDSDKIVNEVFVKEGDKVKIGDKLLSYDTTLMELDLEMYQLDSQTIQLKIEGSKKDLEKLKITVPIKKTEDKKTPAITNKGTPSVEDDEDDEEARADLIQNVVFKTTSQRGSTGSALSGQDESGAQTETKDTSTEEPSTSDTDVTNPTEGGTNSTEGDNTETPDTKTVSVQIKWEHGTNALSAQPGSAAVSLWDGEAKVSEQTVSSDSDWKTAFEQLDSSVNFTVKGQEFADYAITTKKSTNGYVLKYTYKEPGDSPDAVIKPYEVLDYKSEPYKGQGTKDSPYIFFCKDGTKIKGSFINKMLGFDEKGETRLRQKGYYIRLEIREADSLTGGFIKSIGFDGTIRASHGYEPGTIWTFTSDGIQKSKSEIDDPTQKKDPDDDDDDDFTDDDIDWDDGGDFEDGYTEAELKAAIKEKEKEIRDLELDKRENDLKVTKAERELKEATVLSTIQGIVKSVGDPSVGEVDGAAFLVITSDEGLYLKGSVSELKLNSIKKGDVIQAQGNESGISFSATITDVSDYPEDGSGYGYYYGSENSNSSYYPFTAYVENTNGLSNNESAQIFMGQTSSNGKEIYLEKSYVRTENGQSYVYKVDENNKLKQQFVKTGKVYYQQFVEIKEGLSMEDKIAFPYGKNVKNGAKVADESSDGDSGGMGIAVG